MPTISPEPPPATEPHRHRQMAEGFGNDAERYDRTRPRYPDELVQRIVRAAPGTDVLDVGCGTGIAARQFQTAGCTVLGVEPDARMACFARERGLEVEVATFEDWAANGRTFDTVIAAQAWHWIDPRAGAAKAAQVLRPGGRLAIFWNAFNLPEPITQALAEVYRRVVPDSPINFQDRRPPREMYAMMAARTVEGATTAGGFGDVEQFEIDWRQAYTKAEWLDMMPTQGILTQLPQDKLAEVLAHVGAAIPADGFTMNYTAVALILPRA